MKGLTQRQVVLGVYGLLVLGAISVLIPALITAATFYSTTAGLGLVLFGGLLGAYWFGWEPARFLGLALLTILVAVVMPEPFVTGYAPALITLIPLVAMLLGDPYWVVGSSTTLIGILLIRAGGRGVYTDPLALSTIAMIVGGLILSRLVTDTAQHNAEAQARRAEEALARSEIQAADLAQKANELERRNEEQGRLLDLVVTLESPAIALADGVLLAPVVGHLDSRRAGVLIERLLHEVAENRTRLVILDIAGVPTVDTSVAQALMRAVQAVRLLGCDVTITGISASVAATITQLGISLAGVRTARTPQEALEQSVTIKANGLRQN